MPTEILKKVSGKMMNLLRQINLWKLFSKILKLLRQYYIKTKVENIQDNQNILELKTDILELNYKIKSIRLDLNEEYRE